MDDRTPRPFAAEPDGFGPDFRRLGHQLVDVVPDGFVRRVAEEPFGSGVPSPHTGVGVRVDDDDRHRAVLDDCLQIRLLLAQLGLRLLVGGDIVVDGDVALLLTADDHRQPLQFNIHQGAVLARPARDDTDRFAAQVELGVAFGFGPDELRAGHQVFHLPANRLRLRVAKEQFRRRIP